MRNSEDGEGGSARDTEIETAADRAPESENTLYVTGPAQLRRSSRRLLIEREHEEAGAARLREIGRVVLLGRVEVTHAAVEALLEEGVETVLFSSSGRLLGRISPPGGAGGATRRAQFRLHDDPAFRLALAQTLVVAKLRNSRAVLQRCRRNSSSDDQQKCRVFSEAIAALEHSAAAARKSRALPELLGMEGDGSRRYFQGLGAAVRGELAFTGRNRRPPRDPFNALLSFGYTLLASELTTCLAGEGLDPDVGFLHELNPGRPSLALDLLEEFRAPVIDRLCLRLTNLGVLRAEHFQPGPEGGIFLNPPGRAAFLQEYHEWLEAPLETRGERGGQSVRQIARQQAADLRRALTGAAAYTAYVHEG